MYAPGRLGGHGVVTRLYAPHAYGLGRLSKMSGEFHKGGQNSPRTDARDDSRAARRRDELRVEWEGAGLRRPRWAALGICAM